MRLKPPTGHPGATGNSAGRNIATATIIQPTSVSWWPGTRWMAGYASATTARCRQFRPGKPRVSAGINGNCPLIRRRLDGLDVVVGQAKMVPDLVHQNVSHDLVEGILVFRPVIEDRPPVEPDHVGHLCRRRLGAERQGGPLEQAEEVELALEAHLLDDVFGGEVFDPDDEPLAELSEMFGQASIGLPRQGLDIGQRGRSKPAPGPRMFEWTAHDDAM